MPNIMPKMIALARPRMSSSISSNGTPLTFDAVRRCKSRRTGSVSA